MCVCVFIVFPKEFVNPPRIPISSAPEMTEADVLAVGDSLADSLTEVLLTQNV